MIKNLTLALALTLAGTSLYAADAKNDTIKKDKTHMFPKAKEGFVQHVIEVPKTENDNDHRVELLIGKKMLVDCNQRSLRAKVENVTLKGWGFKYLEVSDIHNGPTTMMACPQPKTEKFISVYMGKETLRRYNSRSAIVAYVPEGYEVRYRIWSAGKSVEQAAKR
jgi:ecotin